MLPCIYCLYRTYTVVTEVFLWILSSATPYVIRSTKRSTPSELSPGDALPSIRTLAKDLRISVITTTRAYDELERDGFIDRVPGKGCYVAEQNLELVREAHLKQIEDHMGEIVSLAQGCSLTEEEAVRMLRLMWKMKGSDAE